LELIDTHTHIYLEHFDKDREQVLKNARSRHVKKLLMPNIDSHSIRPMMEVARLSEGYCLPMMGLHPTSVKPAFEAELEIIESWLEKESFVAIGESGIDLYWDRSFLKQQIISFRRHAELALEHDLPLVIHARNSLEEIFDVLDEFKGSKLRGVFHCFPGNVAQAEKAVSMGFVLGIGGVVTYKNSIMAEVVRQVDIRHLLLETDSPYLSPVPKRGKRNESAFLTYIAEKVGELKNLSPEEVAGITTQNARAMFRIE